MVEDGVNLWLVLLGALIGYAIIGAYFWVRIWKLKRDWNRSHYNG